MTQEDKDLLLKDLCARLPYGVKADIVRSNNLHRIDWTIEEDDIHELKCGLIVDIKPYLRPMWSMTMEDEKEYCRLVQDTDNGIEPITNLMDWLNAYHFDYRGLIEKGLALEAPEGMYSEKVK